MNAWLPFSGLLPLDSSLPQWLGYLVVGSPAVIVVLLGLSALSGQSLGETAISRVVRTAVVVGLLAAIAELAWMLSTGVVLVEVPLGYWVHVGHPGEVDYHFYIEFIFDRLSVPLVILSFLLCGTIGAFADRYLHRERGFQRFFLLYALFLLGMVVTSLAGTIETLFAGWELVGLGSALLVAYFHERPAPCRNGLRVWTVYRIGDAALLLAALTLHHLSGEGDFSRLIRGGVWPDGNVMLTEKDVLLIGGLLLIAAAAKSALIPFSGWLPRAMEGPTPSSAVFYGALSVHLGAFLLLRVSPMLDQSLILRGIIVALGLSTACFAALAGRAQTDVKSLLSFASMTQVGLIVAEIGCGWRYLALIHILGHGCLRTLQFLRAPTLLDDYRQRENALGYHHEPTVGFWQRLVDPRMQRWLYRLALERGFFDAAIDAYLVGPAVRTFRACDALERRWIAWLSGDVPRRGGEPAELANGPEESR